MNVLPETNINTPMPKVKGAKTMNNPSFHGCQYIGIKGTGCDYELDIIEETIKAWKVQDTLGRSAWVPIAAFGDDGELKESWRDKLWTRLESCDTDS